MYRIVAEIPRSVKIQIKERLSKNPEETESSIILKDLRAIGMNIKDGDIIDQTKNQSYKNTKLQGCKIVRFQPYNLIMFQDGKETEISEVF